MRILFWTSVGALGYITVVYPCLLAALAKWRAKPVHKAPFLPTVTIIVPTYNGEHFIEAKLKSILALDYPRELLNTIVVSDGSTDGTVNLVRNFASQSVELMVLPRGGKPAALNSAIPHAKGEILVLTDVRQPLESDSLKLLTACFSDPTVGAVSGEIVVVKGNTQEAADIGLYWKMECRIRDWLGSIDSIFGMLGQFSAIRRSLVVPIPVDTLNDDMFLPLVAFFQGYRLIVEPRAKAYDVAMSRKTEFRRKVRTLAGNYQVLFHYPLLTLKNRLWFHYVSYKFGRLLLPWLLVLILVSSLAVQEPLRSTVIAVQGFFYLLAAFDPIIPKSPLKKISSPIKTFCVMMLAVLAGLQIFWVKPKNLWVVTSTTNKL